MSPPAEAPIATSTIAAPAASEKIAATAASAKPPASQRLVSLDIFRGMTIAGMILVNDPGTWSAIYWPLEHAEWHGWTPTDLIFPFFLFIVGVSMTMSFAARCRRGATRAALARHVVLRSLTILAIGWFLHLFPRFHFSTMRYMGVLPRIALCYLCAGLFVVAFARKADLDDFRPNLIAVTSLMIALLVGYWALMTFIPVPGYGAGNLSPDGNLAAYIDRSIMLGHLWKPTWDPEGFLSSLPAIATVLGGVLLGEFLRSARTAQKKFLGMLAGGAAAMLLGRALHPIFPINKNLWTSTFVIFTSGFAMVVLAFCYWLADIRGWRKWAQPFLVFGMNAIASFTLATFLAKCLIVIHVTSGGERTSLWGYLYEHFFEPFARPKNASLAFALCFVAVCWLTMWLLYRRRIFIKV